jgi:hypothetical protein
MESAKHCTSTGNAGFYFPNESFIQLLAIAHFEHYVLYNNMDWILDKLTIHSFICGRKI